MSLKVCVVGAGVAGLSIAKQLQTKGIDFDCYDERDEVGGIWSYSESKERTSAWARLNQNTPKGRYQFSDFPMPDDYPDYPNRSQVRTYLESYAKHFGFLEKIQLNTSIVSATKSDSGGWIVETSSNTIKKYDHLVVANGHHNKANYPEFYYRDSFTGKSIHSGQYRRREEFSDKKVLVVGIGNSGSQIAVDVSHAAEQTYISTRRGVYILPHYLGGLRFDKLFGFVEWWWLHKILPWPFLHQISTLGYRWFLARNENFGLPKPDHRIFESLPTLSENFFNRIGDGRLKVKPAVTKINGNTVFFEDGTQEYVDDIIYSTGFILSFPFLDLEKSDLQMRDNVVPLFKRIFSSKDPSISFIGLFQAVTFGFLHIMEKQSEVVAEYLSGEYKLPTPEDMETDIQSDKERVDRTFTKTLRNNYQMMGSIYLRDLAVEKKAGESRADKNMISSSESTQGSVAGTTPTR
nr:NAD(P)-binding domain-containing protein [uncultured Methylophaga sp.]